MNQHEACGHSAGKLQQSEITRSRSLQQGCGKMPQEVSQRAMVWSGAELQLTAQT